ncbi:hypothetical protein COZ41_03070 [Candidatus Shapirobacteria bacterium CG_4_10_14_3_um_filter_35_13]|uniref:Uncharacterized protein n=1 Tax=Candidatus Shapirobacteria bacterium CG_4_10_14_3_um_filter_35_13 TaxID=1974873 RepID=A0A2M7LIA1_9BACT|nr:MAG: hypothetical protein COZ41_03070 [Candidatus Shapirobacteria bacterium CG_4_10_14_3_um_filter_35_13]
MFVMVVVFWPKKEVVIEKKTIKTISASVVIIPTQDKRPIYSTTGAKLTILSDDEYNLMTLVYLLRQECPINNEYFGIIYDYKINKFVVTIPLANMETFLQWKKDTGYNLITDKYWVIKND